MSSLDDAVAKAVDVFLQEAAATGDRADVRVALDYIHRGLLEPTLSVQGMLHDCRIRSHSFYERFADEVAGETGRRMTPRVYIEWARIRIGSEIVSDCQIRKTRLAYELGFNSYASFYRACRRWGLFGQTD